LRKPGRLDPNILTERKKGGGNDTVSGREREKASYFGGSNLRKTRKNSPFASEKTKKKYFQTDSKWKEPLSGGGGKKGKKVTKKYQRPEERAHAF